MPNKKRAWLTPDLDQLSDPKEPRIIECAGSLFYFIGGAILSLCEPENWELFGDASEDDTAQYFRNILEDFYMSTFVLGSFAAVGAIGQFCQDYVPPLWLEMSGQTLTQSAYPELFAVIPDGWKSGTSFTLPDMAGRGVFGKGTNTYLQSRDFDLGDVGGRHVHPLAANEVPDHSHGLWGSDTTLDSVSPEGKFISEQSSNHYSSGNLGFPTIELSDLSIEPTQNGGDVHENMPPYLVVTYGIYAGR